VKKILLDTHVLLWWIDNKNHKLIGEQARRTISNPVNEIYLSAVSAWEIAIKNSLSSLNAPSDIEAIAERKGFLALPISLFHGEQAGSLPFERHPVTGKIHRDPFDRMLIAQAQAEGMYLMTKDTAFQAYAVRLIDAEK